MPDALTAPMADLREGDVFAGCRVEAVAGRGGMGIVYRAVQLSLGRPVALKLIAGQHAADPEFRDRFEREARLAAAIDHPNVIPVYAAGEEDGRLYLVVRFVRGTDLHHLLRGGGALPPARAAALIEQVGFGLDAAHAAGLVHRDVKPANVLISAQGDHVYLTDFGLSRLVSSDTRLTTTGHWLGTAAYASPEHLRGERTDARSDVYALGCVLYAALTREPPFPRKTVPATMLAHLHDAPPRPSERGLPRAFDEVIARALAKDPADRYPSAGDLGRAAVAAASGAEQPTQERSVAKGPAAPSEIRRPPTAATLWAGRTAPSEAATGLAPATGESEAATAWAPATGESEAATAWAPPTGHAAAAPDAATAVPRPATTDRRDGVLPPPPRPATDAGPMPEDVRVRRSRRRRIRMVAAALLVGALAAGAFAALGDVLAGQSYKTGPLSEAEVQDAAQSFADAYAAEDTKALGAALTGNVQRVLPAGRLNGRAAVVAEYRRQFRAQNTDGYDLRDMKATGGSAGRAAGRYAVKIDGKEQITGKIVFSVVRDGRGKPRIAMIAATPD